MPDGYTPYGYLGKVDDRLIEVVSEEELYELLEDESPPISLISRPCARPAGLQGAFHYISFHLICKCLIFEGGTPL